MFVYIDSFTMCNLRCPSCAVGDLARPELRPLATRKMMTTETLSSVLDKLLIEVDVVEGVGFFNWTEPLLHPQIASLVEEVSKRGIKCWISSNLNVLRNPDELLAAQPYEIIVSVSGFEQDVYQRGHRRGNIETVKNNMRILADAAKQALIRGSRTWLRLVYHRYSDNEHDEKQMERYANELGFVFNPGWAYVTTVERVIDLHVNRTRHPQDEEVLSRLAVPFDQAMTLVDTPTDSCNHIDKRLVMNADADVFICCASSGAQTNIVGNYLSISLSELQERKRKHSLCEPCMHHSVMTYFDRSDISDAEFTALGEATRKSFTTARREES